MYSVANKEQPGIPLPANVAAVWGAFLHEGLMSAAKDEQRTSEVLDAWKQGCIELIIATCEYLPEVWQQITAKWNEEDVDFPGVFEYEVISPLGKFMGDYLLMSGGNLPDTDRVQQKVRQLIQGFFAQPQPDASVQQPAAKLTE
jgi:hypothetical protein